MSKQANMTILKPAELLVAFGNWLLAKYPEGKAEDVNYADLRNFELETGNQVYEPDQIP